MADEYNGYVHTHVTIKHPTAKQDEGWDGAHQILFHTGNRVWIMISYMHEMHPEIVLVTDTTANGQQQFDEQGNTVVSIPVQWCKFYSFEEAEQIEQAIYADSHMYS